MYVKYFLINETLFPLLFKHLIYYWYLWLKYLLLRSCSHYNLILIFKTNFLSAQNNSDLCS